MGAGIDDHGKYMSGSINLPVKQSEFRLYRKTRCSARFYKGFIGEQNALITVGDNFCPLSDVLIFEPQR